ncbi:MAG TPA: HAD family hydrolase [Candidatus Nanoarchaeia archaeon]|nr:HAD family hydrolase [Candidatus Nanoarchaeia archaeon]
MKRAVLFDLDDTLYDYEPCHKKGLKAVYNELKKELKISYKRFNELFETSKKEIKRELEGTASSHNRILYFQRLLEKTHETIESEKTLDLYDAYWNNFLKEMKLKKGVLKTLKELKKQKYKIALVTDLTTHIQLRKLRHLKINKYVDYLVTSEEAGSEKPHLIMFLLALNKLDVSPHEAIMVGDNKDTDIEGANAVRITTLLVGEKGKTKKWSYKKPDYYIKEIPEILKILEKLEK